MLWLLLRFRSGFRFPPCRHRSAASPTSPPLPPPPARRPALAACKCPATRTPLRCRRYCSRNCRRLSNSSQPRHMRSPPHPRRCPAATAAAAARRPALAACKCPAPRTLLRCRRYCSRNCCRRRPRRHYEGGSLALASPDTYVSHPAHGAARRRPLASPPSPPATAPHPEPRCAAVATADASASATARARAAITKVALASPRSQIGGSAQPRRRG